MALEDIIGLGIAGTFLGFGVLEALSPARAFPKAKLWKTRGILSFLLMMTLTTLLPPLWDGWFGAHRLIDATGLGTLAGALWGFVVLELGSYFWHRTMHNTPLLWRAFHQMHHSAERVDIWGAVYFHPLDMIGFSAVYSFTLIMVAGVSPEAALIANLTATFYAFFQHANIRTPHWLGYIIQRPESHSAHHERGVHAYNYSDLPLWDIVFGTFKNPATWQGQAGFYDGASLRVPEMLVGMDVSEPKKPARDSARAELTA
jgi:sterol desaturase/sphingolipid hydroxylase (fatty acid hydroxylase superfamily)